MVVVIIGMLVCVVLALIVIALVALPARRDGEALFLPRDGDDDRDDLEDLDGGDDVRAADPVDVRRPGSDTEEPAGGATSAERVDA